ncbi:MAG: MFS transporter, partial [Actinomycetota bacterium]
TSPEQIIAAVPSTSWDDESPVSSDRATRITVEARGSELVLRAEYDDTVPYFWWAFDGLIRSSMKAHLRRTAKVLDARVAGEPEPAEPKRPWWAPPGAMTADQIRMIATISLILAFVEYGQALLTQTVDYLATTYDASNAQLGVVTAVTRVGNLLVLAGGLLADRLGRRRLLLAAMTVVLVATSLSAIAPSLATFGFLQVLVNGGTNLAFLVGIVAAVEEAPEGARTYTIAIVGIAAGIGFAIGAVLLPLADLRPDAWRALYALAAVGLLVLPKVAKSLKETTRFERLIERKAETGRVSEVVDKRYGGRFVLLCVTGFLINVFFAPQSQFTNRYLGDERGFSGLGILIVRAVTQTLPAFGAAYLGGKWAETRGRKPIAIQGIIIGALFTAAFFWVGGPFLWIFLAIGTAGQSAAGPSLSAFSTELFPTEVRGTAGAGLTITGVMGSAAGLLLAGYLAEPLGSVGKAVAVTAIAPVIVALFLIRRLPEAKGQNLDEVSPSEV